MRIIHAPGRLVVADTPGCMWLFGSAFVASGSFALLAPFVAGGLGDLEWWEVAVVLIIGASHLAGGLWVIRTHGATRTELDVTTGTGTHRVRPPGDVRATITRFSLSEARSVEIRESRDSDGDPMYQLRLWLAGGRVLSLQGQPTHGREAAALRAREIRRFLDVPDAASS